MVMTFTSVDFINQVPNSICRPRFGRERICWGLALQDLWSRSSSGDYYEDLLQTGAKAIIFLPETELYILRWNGYFQQDRVLVELANPRVTPLAPKLTDPELQ